MQKTDTKTKIFKAAAELFSRNGYYNVSVNEICAAAGVTKPSLYYYFEDKEQLLYALVQESLDVVQRLADEIVSEDDAFLENLDQIIRLYKRYTQEYTYLIPFSFSVQFTPLPDSIKSMMYSKVTERWHFFLRFFAKGQKEGHLPSGDNPELLMRSLFNPLSVIIIQDIIKAEKTDVLEKHIMEYFTFWKNKFVTN